MTDLMQIRQSIKRQWLAFAMDSLAIAQRQFLAGNMVEAHAAVCEAKAAIELLAPECCQPADDVADVIEFGTLDRPECEIEHGAIAAEVGV